MPSNLLIKNTTLPSLYFLMIRFELVRNLDCFWKQNKYKENMIITKSKLRKMLYF